jgi:dTDP-glucose 4,6-dehydratase
MDVMKTILVTGGAGFIGSNFILYMLDKYDDYQIINLDKLTYAGNIENLKSVEDDARYTFIKGDICDRQCVKGIFLKYDIDYVVNFAAESHVDRSIDTPDVFVRTNVLGTNVLLDVAKEAWKCRDGFLPGKKFLQISTDEVYGSLGAEGYFTEETPLAPRSPYSASKTSADLIVMSYYHTFNMPINITRCSNNYGPYQYPEKLIPLMIYNCLHGRKLPIYGDGKNVRDWLYVEDHCRAIDMVLHNGRIGEVYNVGGHNEWCNIDIVKTIIGYLNDHVDDSITEDLIQYVEDRKGHDRRYAIDPTKIGRELGWKPTTTFNDGIVRTIDWYINNRDWMEAVLSKEED